MLCFAKEKQRISHVSFGKGRKLFIIVSETVGIAIGLMGRRYGHMASQRSQDAAMRLLKSWRFRAITKAALELVFCGCLL